MHSSLLVGGGRFNKWILIVMEKRVKYSNSRNMRMTDNWHGLFGTDWYKNEFFESIIVFRMTVVMVLSYS